MLKSDTRPWLEIDLSRISHNMKGVQKLIPPTGRIMVIVKANGYGHGGMEYFRMMGQQGIDFFGAGNVDEGVRLCENGIRSPILVLGYTPSVYFHYPDEASLIRTLVLREYTEELNAYAKEQNVVIEAYVKVDTGMSGIGIIAQDYAYHIEDIEALYRLKYLGVCGVFSHFSVSDCLDEGNCAFTNRQTALFERVLVDLHAEGIGPGTTHLQNSYGILGYPNLHYDYVRPSLLWMGVTSDDALAIRTTPQFQPIVEWGTNVSLIKDIQPSVTVSYDRHFEAEVCTRAVTLAVGYADDSPRSVSNQGIRVLLHGRRTPIIGNICVGQMMADIIGLDGVGEGDVVTPIGCDGSEVLFVGELSRLTHTINNEILCWISQRAPRIYEQSQQVWLFFKRKDG